MVVERFGHVASLSGSFFISFLPIAIFAIFMPETMNTRGKKKALLNESGSGDYVLA